MGVFPPKFRFRRHCLETKAILAWKVQAICNKKIMFFFCIEANECFTDGVHNMQRAYEEAQSIVQAIHVMNQDPKMFLAKNWTAGQVMVFLTYFIIICLTTFGTAFTRNFKTKVYATVSTKSSKQFSNFFGNIYRVCSNSVNRLETVGKCFFIIPLIELNIDRGRT